MTAIGRPLNQDWEGATTLAALANRLWEGRAAVMVGAGFSRNATPITQNAPPFPLWFDLARALLSAYPSPVTQRRLDKLSPEALADRFRVTPGNDALNSILVQTIPDDKHEPGAIHLRLLDLPWSDVFTTNYDTLLERAAQKIWHRKYDVVRHHSDLARKVQPRLVKLHGTLGDENLILGTEDYRTYPTIHAPFVNTVQQSLLENAFCLIGFSGTDSNFITWTGWVRDNLGKSAPPGYLCGYLNMDQTDVIQFHQRGIQIIDLAPLVSKDSLDPHAEAAEILISWLEILRPPTHALWPVSGPTDDGPKGPERFDRLLEKWKERQTSYPGWLTPPDDVIGKLSQRLHRELDNDFINYIASLEPLLQIRALEALEWQRRLSFRQVAPGFVDYVSNFIRQLIKSESEHDPNTRYAVTHLAVSYLHLFRAVRDELAFDTLCSFLEKSSMLTTSDRLWLIFERCHWELDSLSITGVQRVLSRWPETTDPEWMGRHATILAEIGERERAIQITEKALSLARSPSSQLPGKAEAMLSVEGWLMLLLDALRQAVDLWGATPQELDSRWQILANHRCDPRPTLNRLAERIEKTLVEASEEIVQSFDGPRQIRRWGDPGASAYSAFSFVEFMNYGLLPLTVAGQGTRASDLTKAAARLFILHPERALLIFIRGGKPSDSDKILDRIRLATLNLDIVQRVFHLCLQAIKELVEQIRWIPSPGFPPWQRRAEALCEIASRLCLRTALASRIELIHEAARLHEAGTSWTERRILHDACSNIFRRAIRSIGKEEVSYEIAAMILELPLPPEDPKFKPPHWKEPSDYLLHTVDAPLEPGVQKHIRQMATVLLASTHPTSPRRSEALIRLFWMNQSGWLVPGEVRTLAASIWSDYPGSGLPSGTPFRPHAFLTLPAPDDVELIQLVREYFVKGRIPNLVVTSAEAGLPDELGQSHVLNESTCKSYFSDLAAAVPLVDAECFLRFNEEEARVIWEGWRDWYRRARAFISGASPFTSSLRLLMNFSISVIAKTCLVRFQTDRYVVDAREILDEMEHEGLWTLPGRLFLLRDASPDEAISALSLQLRRDILAHNHNADLLVVNTVRLWITAGIQNLTPPIPRVVVDSTIAAAFRLETNHAHQYVDIMSFGIRKNEPNFRGAARDAICLLEVLRNESAAPSEAERLTTAGRIAVEHRTNWRTAGMRLASSLFSAGVTDPELDKWKNVASSDALPEVRDAWNIDATS